MTKPRSRLSFPWVLLGAGCVAGGCGHKKLTKEDAQQLLEATLYQVREVPTCSMYAGQRIGRGEYGPKMRLSPLGGEACSKHMMDLGVAASVDPLKPSDMSMPVVSLSPRASVACESRDDDCRATFECGSVEATIDSIVTEERRATVKYTLQRKTSDKFNDVSRLCIPKVLSKGSESRQFEAVLDDEGRWRMK